MINIIICVVYLLRLLCLDREIGAVGDTESTRTSKKLYPGALKDVGDTQASAFPRIRFLQIEAYQIANYILGRQTVISFHSSTLQTLLNQFKWTIGSLKSTNQEVIVTTYVQE